MKRFYPYIISAVCILVIVLASSCGNNVVTPAIPATETRAITTATETETATQTITSTPDPCAPGYINEEVNKVHNHMREFDDASLLAANMPRDQVSNAIPDLQRIRRESEDQPIPVCLANLKTFQIAHMNSVINTLIAFMNGSDQQSIDQGISIARQQHDQYSVELASVLGLTVVPATIPPTIEGTPPADTPTP